MNIRFTILSFLFFLFFLLAGIAIPSSIHAGDKFLAVIITGDLPRYREAHEAFVRTLQRGGSTEDQVQIYVQTPNPDPMSWVNSIRKAVGVGADLIVTYGAPVTLTARKEARGIPVLFADVYDPVRLGIVKSLTMPGDDITGVSSKTPLSTLVKNFVEVKSVKVMGVIYDKGDPGGVHQIEELERLSGEYGFSVARTSVSHQKELEEALAALPPGLNALFIAESPVLHLEIDRIMSFSGRRDLPVLSQIPGLCDEGALMTLAAEPKEQGRLAGVHALRILGGQPAHLLPVRTPKRVSLVVNIRIAREYGLTVPFRVLGMATRIIK